MKEEIGWYRIEFDSEFNSTFIGSNIWMINFKFNLIIYDLSWIMQLRKFVSVLRSSVWDVLNLFLFIYATDHSKISTDHFRIYSISDYTPYLFREHSL